MNGNANRSKSDKYGLVIYLPHEIHMWIHQTSDGQKVAKVLKRKAQEHFERVYGHEKWMSEFHKNYIGDYDVD